MARLALFLLGSPRLERDGEPLQFDTRKILALVAYVAISGMEGEGGRISRDSLLTLLWPELETRRARAVLRRNLSLLRSALEDEWLVVDRQTVGVDPRADFWLDVEQFTRLAHAGETHDHPPEQICRQCLQALAKADALYRGDFMEGFGLRDSVAFDDWQFFQTEGLRQELASVLERRIRGHSAFGDYEAALPAARRWLALDPLHEPAHRQLMQLYALVGQRSAALRQYQECVRILDEEIGVAPDAETTALYEQIHDGSLAQTGPPGPLDLIGRTGLPARSASPRHNLPAQTTAFVGREEEIAEIGSRLLDPACRLLTLLGPGGIGKTRLALRLARNLVGSDLAAFEHGVFFVPLAPIQTAEGVIPAVAEALGYCCHSEAEGRPRTTLRQQLLDYLSRKRLLLVLDNYEQLLVEGVSQNGGSEGDDEGDGIGFLTELLADAPGIKILVTSRTGLKVRGEHLYHLAGLQVPDRTLSIPAEAREALRGYSAVRLFEQGAQQVRPDFALRSQDLVHVADICRLVQGMPLGILLAASWVEMLALEEIGAEIQHSLDFLETDLRDVPPRQRSIRAVFDHTWRMLDERERETFQGLSVFRGGFTREAALEVTGASLRDLMSLANKSLLIPSSTGRYELHELLRQYGAERLKAATSQDGAVRDRHCAYFIAALERWGQELKGARQREAAAEMDLEIENVRATWHWAADHGQVSRLAQGVEGMWLYLTRRLRYEEGEATFRKATQSLEAMGSDDARRLRVKCLVLWSHFLLDMDKMQQADSTAEQGEALLQELERSGLDVGPEAALAAFHRSRIVHYYYPDPLEAKQGYKQSVALYEKVDDRWGMARALSQLGWMAEVLGHYGEARALCKKGLAIQRELSDQGGVADSMLKLGIISWVQGRLDEADRLLRESVGIFRTLDDWNGVAHTIKTIGEVLIRRGLFEDGLVLMETSAEIYEDLGHRFGVAGLFPFLAEARLHLGDYGAAHADAERGVTLAVRMKHRWGVGFARFVQGLVALAEGAPKEAQALFQESIAVFQEVRHRENLGWVLGPLGLAVRGGGEAEMAREYVLEALQIGLDLEAFMPLLYGLPAAALLLADRGAAERALEVYACVLRYPFVAESRWFEDMTGTSLRAVAASLPREVAEQAQERGRAGELADVARSTRALLDSAAGRSAE